MNTYNFVPISFWAELILITLAINNNHTFYSVATNIEEVFRNLPGQDSTVNSPGITFSRLMVCSCKQIDVPYFSYYF